MFDLVGAFVLSTLGVWTACTVIVMIALLSAFAFWRKISPVTKELKIANRKLTIIEGEKGFSECYEEFNEWVSKSKLLGFPWREFTETLIFEPEMPIRNTQDAETFFNDSTLLIPTLNLRFYNSLPNIITGTGILGTFIGLVFGVHDASQNIVATTTANIPPEIAMQKLLGGASLAFMTSIAGLGGSILFSWYEKHLLNRAQGLIQTWNFSLDERLLRLTPEKLAADSLKEVKQQTQELKMFNTELAWQIASALDEKMAGRLAPSLDKLVLAVEGLRDDRDQTNQELLKEIVDKFTDTLKNAAGKEMEAFAGTIKELNEKLSGQIIALDESHKQVSDKTTKLLIDIAETYESSALGIQGILEKTDITAQNIATSAQNFLGVAERLENCLPQLETIARRLENVSLTLEETGEGLKEINQGNAEAIVAIQDGVEKLHDLQETISAAWEDYRSRFEDIDKGLESFFTRIQEGVQAYSEQVHGFMMQMDKNMSKVVDHLGSAASETGKTVEGLSDQLSDIQDTFDKFVQKLPVQTIGA